MWPTPDSTALDSAVVRLQRAIVLAERTDDAGARRFEGDEAHETLDDAARKLEYERGRADQRRGEEKSDDR